MIQRLNELGRYLRIISGVALKEPSARPQSDVVVTLTTTPARIVQLRYTIASLLDQTLLPRQIRLYLPVCYQQKQDYKLPAFLKECPLLEIVRVPKDWGPATKWFYALHDDAIPEDTPLMVVDDDQIYPKALIAHFVAAQGVLPKAALTLFGWNVPSDFNHSNRQGLSAAQIYLFRKSYLVRAACQVDCVQGASSYYFLKGALTCSEELLQELGGWVFADDILVSGLLASARTPVYVMPAPLVYARLQVPKTAREGLIHSVNHNNRNNNALYRYFKDDWYSLKHH